LRRIQRDREAKKGLGSKLSTPRQRTEEFSRRVGFAEKVAEILVTKAPHECRAKLQRLLSEISTGVIELCGKSLFCSRPGAKRKNVERDLEWFSLWVETDLSYGQIAKTTGYDPVRDRNIVQMACRRMARTLEERCRVFAQQMGENFRRIFMEKRDLALRSGWIFEEDLDPGHGAEPDIRPDSTEH